VGGLVDAGAGGACIVRRRAWVARGSCSVVGWRAPPWTSPGC